MTHIISGIDGVMPAMIAFELSTMAQLYFDKQQTRERLAQIY